MKTHRTNFTNETPHESTVCVCVTVVLIAFSASSSKGLLQEICCFSSNIQSILKPKKFLEILQFHAINFNKPNFIRFYLIDLIKSDLNTQMRVMNGTVGATDVIYHITIILFKFHFWETVAPNQMNVFCLVEVVTQMV